MPFICGQADNEDLSDKVADALNSGGLVALGAGTSTAAGWRVVVKCTQGHANVFAGRGEPVPPPTFDVKGLPPNAADELLVKAVGHLSPVDSLTRLDTTAKFLIGLVSSISILGTAFGLLSAPASPSVWLVSIPAILGAASIVFALGAVIPQAARISALGDLSAVQAHVERLITKRARLVAISGVLLAAALLSLPFVRALAVAPAPAPAVRVGLTSRAMDGNRGFSVTVKGVGLRAAEQVVVEVKGLADATTVWETADVLAAASSQADDKGALELTFEIQRPATEPYRIIRAQAAAKSTGLTQVDVAASKILEARQ